MAYFLPLCLRGECFSLALRSLRLGEIKQKPNGESEIRNGMLLLPGKPVGYLLGIGIHVHFDLL